MRIRVFVLFVLLGVIGRADAGGWYYLDTGAYYQAEEILDRCEEGQEGSSVLLYVCESYLAGTIDATYTWVELGYIPKKICIPQNVRTSQLRRIFVKYAKEHPEGLHLKGSSISLEAFRNAFDCDSRNNANYYYTADKMLSWCESKYPLYVHSCRGYLSGIADALDTWTTQENISKIICTPDRYAANTLRKIYVEYANNHPEDLHKSASSVALDPYRQVFICG